MARKLTLEECENRHNFNYPNDKIKVLYKKGRYVYFQTHFGICKKLPNSFGKYNYSVITAIDKVNFIKLKLLELYGNKYIFIFDKYINNNQIIEMKCDIHGSIYNSFGHILSGKAGCKTCANILNNPNKLCNNEIFIKKAKEIHGERYDYSLVEYKGNNLPIKIICSKHGIFQQTPNNHLKPSNCPTCNNEIKHDNGCGWSLKKWSDNGEKSKYFDSFKIYILKCWNDEEEFYKIGKTFTTIERRFRNSFIPYNFKVLQEIIGTAEYTHNLEKQLKRLNKKYKYLPKINFGGKYECFYKINLNNINNNKK